MTEHHEKEEVKEKVMEVKKPAGKKEKSEKDELLEQIGAVLTEYHGLESNIPVNHEYWNLLAKYRSLQ